MNLKFSNLLKLIALLPPLILGACGDELTQTADRLSDTVSTVAETAKPLRLQTIEELENLSASDIPGDFAGFEIEEISWQCTDTVDFSRLLFDIDATLISPTQQKQTVRFAAEVGPDLVSVEYYPTGEIMLPHDNLGLAFYPKVERYRNYSDGSRIGPDVFYDYGMPLGFSLTAGGNAIDYQLTHNPAILDLTIYADETVGLERNGIIYNYQKSRILFNTNTRYYSYYGEMYTGEDFIYNYSRPFSESWIYKDFYGWNCGLCVDGPYYLDYDGDTFTPILMFNQDDETTALSSWIAKDAEDISPIPFPKDTRGRSPGFYVSTANHFLDEYCMWYSRLVNDKFDNIADITGGLHIDFIMSFYNQYMVIDGRVIHFNDDWKDFNMEKDPDVSIIKDGNKYLCRTETEFKVYGQKFHPIHDLEMILEDEPETIVDDRWASDIDKWEEKNSMKTPLNKSYQDQQPEFLPVEKHIEISKELPKSLNNRPKTSNIKK